MMVFVLEYGQDDPAKCTARKMVKLGLATNVSRKFHASNDIIVLNPYADKVLTPEDRGVKGLLVVDASWKQAHEVFFKKRGGKHRHLPGLLAGNPTNYSMLGMLSSVEAVAAALYILGEVEEAERFLSIYKWGETFETLNKEPLEEYSRAKSASDVHTLESEFFPQLAQLRVKSLNWEE
jgi:pre-rRNA-processing protein TSR3